MTKASEAATVRAALAASVPQLCRCIENERVAALEYEHTPGPASYRALCDARHETNVAVLAAKKDHQRLVLACQ